MIDQILCALICVTVQVKTIKYDNTIPKNEPQQISTVNETTKRPQVVGDTNKRTSTTTNDPTSNKAEHNVPANVVVAADCPYRDLIYKYFGETNGRIAVAIAMAETHCNPKAHNDGDAKYYPYVASTGLFQHHEGYFTGWDDPEVSTKKALDKFNTVWNGKKRGFTPWSVWSSGAYLKYL